MLSLCRAAAAPDGSCKAARLEAEAWLPPTPGDGRRMGDIDSDCMPGDAGCWSGEPLQRQPSYLRTQTALPYSIRLQCHYALSGYVSQAPIQSSGFMVKVFTLNPESGTERQVHRRHNASAAPER